MDIMEKMEAEKPNFTKTDHRIYELVKADRQYIRVTAARIAEDYDLSQAALTRFSQKLGYNGYNEFKYELTRQVHRASSEKYAGSPWTEIYIKNFQYFEENGYREKCREAAEIMGQASRIYITGYHRSFLAAQLLNYNLLDFCYDSICLRADEIFRIGAFSKEGSLLIIFSVSNPTFSELISAIEKLKEKRPRIMLVTLSEKHPLSKRVDYVYALPNLKSSSSDYMEPMVMFGLFVHTILSFLNSKNK